MLVNSCIESAISFVSFAFIVLPFIIMIHGVHMVIPKIILYDQFEKLKQKGLKTRDYTTKSGEIRKAQQFNDQTIRRILTNKAYIAKREINKSNKNKDQSKLNENKQYGVVDGVWEPIIKEDQFYAVQEIFNLNRQKKGNVVSKKRRNFLLAGLIICPVCSPNGLHDESLHHLETGSGTSKNKRQYYTPDVSGSLVMLGGITCSIAFDNVWRSLP